MRGEEERKRRTAQAAFSHCRLGGSPLELVMPECAKNVAACSHGLLWAVEGALRCR
jgi:hypothetical protein